MRSPGRRTVSIASAAALALGLLCARPADGRELPAPVAATPASGAPAEMKPALPMTFEENAGQTDARVKYVARGKGYTVFVAEGEVVLALAGRDDTARALRMNVTGARREAVLTGEEPLPGKANYMLGSDPSAWHTEIPTYGRVRGRDVVPGVDLALYGTERQLEYDLVVSPGADPSSLEVVFDGVDEVTVDEESGDAVLRVGDAEIRQQRAVVYQMVDGKRQPIACQYSARGGHAVGFEIGSYDTAAPLVVDPVLVFSTYFGGDASIEPGSESGSDIAVDGAGSSYVTGSVFSVGFPTTAGAYDTTYNFVDDAFVTKLSANGSTLVYSTYLGSNVSDVGNAIAVDSSGNAYVAGRNAPDVFQNLASNFPTTPGAFDTTYNGNFDGFLAKLNPSGSALVYSTYFGSSARDEIFDVAVDASGAAYVTGYTEAGPDFVTTPGAYDRTPDGFGDAFVTKFNPDGATLAYSTFLGGSGAEDARAIAIDASGAAYVAGSTTPPQNVTPFPTTGGAFDTTHAGQHDVFVTKLDAAGATLAYSTLLGGADEEESYDLAVDSLGSAYVVGYTRSNTFPTTPGSFDTTFGSFQNAFLTKLNAAGTGLVFSTYFGDGNDRLYGVALDGSRNVYLTGRFANSPITGGAFDPTFNGGASDAICAKLAASGISLIYSTYLGGGDEDIGYSVAVDGAGNAYVTGSTMNNGFSLPIFPSTAGSYDPTHNGGSDVFVTKVNATGGGLVYSTFLGGQNPSFDESARAIAVDAAGNRYVTGTTTSVNFPTTAGAYDTTPAAQSSPFSLEGFVTKFDPAGTSLVYSTYLGGDNLDTPLSIKVDAAGAAYVGGVTQSSNFPTTPGALDTTTSIFREGFVSKLTPSGSALAFSTYLGGSFDDQVSAIDVDAQGNVYAAGWTASANFQTTPGAFDTTSDANGSVTEGFAAKINPTGTAFVYSTLLGGTGVDLMFDVAVDPGGAAYVVGFSDAPNYPTTAGAFDTTLGTAGSGQDAVVTKVSPSGAALDASTFLGGPSTSDTGEALARGVDGTIYVTGRTSGSGFPTTPGAYQTTPGSIFVTSFDPSLSTLGYSTLIGSIGAIYEISDIAVTSTGAAIITGNYDRPFPTTPDAVQPGHAGDDDVFVTMFRPDGGALLYSTFLGGRESDLGYGLAVDRSDAIYVVGSTQSIAFPTVAPYSAARRGYADAFIAKISVPAKGDNPGVVVASSGAWFLKYTNANGPADVAFTFGAPGSGTVPLAGDWDGDGDDTIAIYDPATGAFFLKNTNAGGSADVVFTFGAGGPGVVPLSGDWNGDGVDTVGLYVQATGAFFLRNANSSGPADVVFTFGAGGAGVTPLAGDWNGDGTVTVGLYAASTGTFFLRNSNSPGAADLAFSYGPAGATPITGDWNGDGLDTVGVYSSSDGAWFLRNTNTPGAAHLVFTFGPAGVTPLVGNWDGQ